MPLERGRGSGGEGEGGQEGRGRGVSQSNHQSIMSISETQGAGVTPTGVTT